MSSQLNKSPPARKASSTMSTDSKKTKKKAVEVAPQASIGDMMYFPLGCPFKVKLVFALGILGGIGNGLVYPALAYVFSDAFSKISAASNNGLDDVRELAYTFMVVGAYALVCATIQTTCMEYMAYHATQSFRLQWFQALLRQDSAFFDAHDVGGIANTIGPNANRYRRGMGRKFGEGIQFFTTGVFGLVYAFYASWRVAFIVLCVVPFIAVAAMATVSLNQGKGARAAKAYSKAGSVAYSTVSAMRTVLSLNATPEMIRQYKEATQVAFKEAVEPLVRIGFANGSMLGAFLCCYAVLALYGTYLLYSDVEDTGCDPSDGVIGNETCESSGADVFGAMLGVAFAAQGVSQVGNFIENFTAARVAAYPAIQAMNRVCGAPEEKVYEELDEDIDELNATAHSMHSVTIENGKVLKAILPKYCIDSSSDEGLKPTNVSGAISFSKVKFAYPTRPSDPILTDLTLDVQPGQTIAFVGPSGGGKSTLVSLIERFYDPLEGSVSLDGVNLKDINVTHLRSLIGYVGQEPTLFATTIRGNIRYGNPDATDKQIEEAARMANAHDFISSFPDGYDTQVGDKGAQLSGGQKQRIAIARVLVANPSILLLDEATSALDSESELVVQDALDNVVAQQKRTTIIIAHRLSTIRNADVIAVIGSGTVLEKGTHDELMAASTGHYRKLVDRQEQGQKSLSRGTSSMSRSSSRTSLASEGSEKDAEATGVPNLSAELGDLLPHVEFKNVTFAYPTRPRKNVLDGFSLAIRKGETVALVGPSGGGKSTTVGLIERFYDPAEGVVEYQGHDIKSLNVEWYRDQIGYVGQEPTLFDDTIASNIAFGAPGASKETIEKAAMEANAHDFITSFPLGYDTPVGERGTQLSGGQKQRIAIARALVKKPKLILLDEATSALDTDSEAIVQAALDKIMESRDHTIIVIAHRLSTISNADRIAFIADGGVKEYGTHDELIEKKHGRYRRLVESQQRGSTLTSVGVDGSSTKKTSDKKEDEEEEEDEKDKDMLDWEAEAAEEEKQAFSLKRARDMASPDTGFMFVGSIGAVMAGGVFPMWGLMFSETIDILFRRVEPCDDDTMAPPPFSTCQDYWDSIVDTLRDRSFELAGFWAVIMVGCVIGNVLTFWGFGHASERLNKRVRDDSFTALVRQEIAFFDRRSVGSITSQLQDDAARIHTFSGEPVRASLIALSSVLTGVIISFAFMWPFALLAICCIPVMGFATSIEMKKVLGEDAGTDDVQDELNSPGGIAVETLLNIKTVSALTLEKQRFENYKNALINSEPEYIKDGVTAGLMSGISMFIQQWINGLQMWWGGYLLFNYPGQFEFRDFNIANFALLFSLFGLGGAFQDMSDRKETEKSAGRIFYLLDRESAIDPLSKEGKKLD